MQIFIAKPGGQKEGPFTLDQINQELSAHKFSFNDYWAWHEGMPQWVPLYQIPGVNTKPDAAPPAAKPAPKPEPKPVATASVSPVQPAPAKPTARIVAPVPSEPKPVTPAPATAEVAATIPTAEAIAPKTQAPPKPSSPPIVTKVESAASPEDKPEPPPAAKFSQTLETVEPVPVRAKPLEKPVTSPEPQVISREGVPVETIEKPEIAPSSPEPGSVVSGSRPAPMEAVEPDKSTSAEAGPTNLPFAALEQIFVFTSGEGRTVFQSQSITRKLEEFTGEPLQKVRDKVHVDVIGHANVGVDLMLNKQVPDKAWRVMFSIRPVVAQGAKDEEYKMCTRAFTTETSDTVAVLLFYNNQKL